METAPLLRTYDEACLLWIAKGWGQGAVVRHLAEDETLDEFNLSQPSISRRILSAEPIPPPVAKAIEGLETRKGYEHRTEVVEEGLRAAHGQTTTRDAQELALALLAHLPADDLALKLADALLAQARMANGNGSLLDVFATAIAGRLPHIDTVRLARSIAKRLNGFGAKRVAVAGGVGGAVACAVGLALFFALPSRSQAAPPGPFVVILANARADGSPVWFEPESFLAMGERRPLDQTVPDRPLPGQKLPPCDAGLGQEEMGGGCWGGMKNVKPPCGRLFRRGDTCYLPVAADPQKPVGSDTSHTPAQ